MKQHVLMLPLLIVFFAFVIGDVHVSITGSDAPGCGSSDTPCASLSAALSATTSEPVIVSIQPGEYKGNQNIDITLPRTEISITNENPHAVVVFDCENSETYLNAFHTNQSFSLQGISIINCNKGILFDPIESTNLSLSDTTISNCNTGLLIHGGNVFVDSSVITNCTKVGEQTESGSAIFISDSPLLTPNIIQITNSSISYTESYGMYINEDMQEITMTGAQFNHYGSIYLQGGASVEGTISFSNFTGYSSEEIQHAVDISGGHWHISHVKISENFSHVCSVALSLDTSMAMIENTDISVGNFGVYVYEGRTVIAGGSILGCPYGVGANYANTSKNKSLEIQRTRIESESNILGVYCDMNESDAVNIAISDSYFDSGKIIIGCPANGQITNTSISGVEGDRAVSIRREGTWEFHKFSLLNSSPNGGINFTNSEISASFTECAFENNNGDDGGALYFAGKLLNISTSEFKGNIATGKGGGLYLQSGTCNLASSVVFSGNSAAEGAAIYCTGDSEIIYEEEGKITLEGNMNNSGSDITCGSASTWWTWLIASLLAIPFVIVAIGLSYSLHQRRTSAPNAPDDDDIDLHAS